jgi:predicted nucleic acid-binding protein
VTALFDTDVIIDLLGNIDAAWEEHERYSVVAISRITWIEAQVGARTETDRVQRAQFLAAFRLVELDAQVAQRALSIRREHRLKLPDAIVWASARHVGALLVTRNIKDFPKGEPSVRFPYKL